MNSPKDRHPIKSLHAERPRIRSLIGSKKNGTFLTRDNTKPRFALSARRFLNVLEKCGVPSMKGKPWSVLRTLGRHPAYCREVSLLISQKYTYKGQNR
jgi:hypothetical protein